MRRNGQNIKECQDGEFCAKKRCIPHICHNQFQCGLGNKCVSNKCIVGCWMEYECKEFEIVGDIKRIVKGSKECIDGYCSISPGNYLCDLLHNLAALNKNKQTLLMTVANSYV